MGARSSVKQILPTEPKTKHIHEKVSVFFDVFDPHRHSYSFRERGLDALRERSGPMIITTHFVKFEQTQPLLVFVIASHLGEDPRCY